MNLKSYLTIRIALVAVSCMLVAFWYVAWQAEREFRQQSTRTLETVAKQLRLQMTTISSGFGRADGFPYWGAEIESGFPAGFCVKYVDARGHVAKSSCSGSDMRNQAVPPWFAVIYRVLLMPGTEISLPIAWRGRDYGNVIGVPNVDSHIAQAWRDMSILLVLVSATVLAVCMLTYVVVNRALRPARDILMGLERLERGDLSSRLPRFDLIELQKLSEGINRLACGLEQSIAQRAELTCKLVNLQEEERGYLARELHDEFGQCLAAIKAVAASVGQTADQQCPALRPDADQLTRIAQHLMDMVRSLLRRLRPPGIDELGLVESLKSLIAQWNGSATQIQLDVQGDFERVPQTIAVNIYRIVQECLTNAAKHSAATTVKVRLERDGLMQSRETESRIGVTVEDNGMADGFDPSRSPGMGLLGMRERVAALGGQLLLHARPSSGLVIRASIPIPVSS
jgi:signal transduction histidine kinase